MATNARTQSAGGLLRVGRENPEYQRRAREEAAFWDRVHPLGLEARDEDDGPAEQYANERFTGDRHVPWEATICRYGTFTRGLFLGTNSLALEGRILATNPSLHLTFLDISPGALERRRDGLGALYPGRVGTWAEDLNFAELESETHDLVVSSASLHHVTNLEHVGFQINRTLRPGGYFFLQDYVGEPRFQCAPVKKRVFELLHDRALGASGDDATPGIDWLDDSDLSPFCGVRSDEVLPVLRDFLVEVSVRTTGALTIALMRSRPRHGKPMPPPRLPRRILVRLEAALRRMAGRRPRATNALVGTPFYRQLEFIGNLLTDAGSILPGNAFAVYRKR